jgi:ligand-binding SRPBCC domain-containing protein
MLTFHKNPNRRGWILETELWVPEAIDDVFSLFADAFQLEAITPPWLHFQVLTPRPIDIREGTLIDYRLRLHGIPVRWQSEITAWEPPYRFIDEQRRGPYRRWHHEHTFESQDGGTLCRDRVEYDVPGGSLINRLFVAPDLRRIFHYRREQFPKVLAKSLENRLASTATGERGA